MARCELRSHTLISPSAEPVTKRVWVESMAKHLTACSCARKVCSSRDCLMSQMQTAPFLPALIKSWCCVAWARQPAPASWQLKAITFAFLGGSRVSQRDTFRPSVECPAVASREALPPWNTKSEVFLEWVWRLKNGAEVLEACQSAVFPSPSQRPNLFPCWVNTILFTLVKTPAG